MSGIIFDLDDTLYNERDFVMGGFHAVAEYLSSKAGKPQSSIFDKIVEIFNCDGRGQIFNAICDQLGCQCDIKQLIEIYRTSQPTLTLFDDARDAISDLNKLGHKLGIITDGLASVQWNKIKLLGLIHDCSEQLKEQKTKSMCEAQFEIVVTDDHGQENWKPSPFPYKLICEKFGLEPSNCVYIGDNANKDFITAKKLGMRTVHIRRDTGDHKDFVHDDDAYNAEKQIHSLNQLIPVLEEFKLV